MDHTSIFCMVVILSLGEGSLFGLSDIIEILRSLYFLRMTQWEDDTFFLTTHVAAFLLSV